jgi:hypothetical protein
MEHSDVQRGSARQLDHHLGKLELPFVSDSLPATFLPSPVMAGGGRSYFQVELAAKPLF